LTWKLKADLKGPALELRTSSTQIQWRVAGGNGSWQNLKLLSELQGPQGLPGVNGVANDTATATNVSGPSATRTAIDAVLAGYHFDRFPTALGRFNASMASRVTSSVVIVVAGSSTPLGTGASTPGNRWVNLFANAVLTAYQGGAATAPSTLTAALASPPTGRGIHFVNAAVSGTTAANYLTATTGPQVASLNPSVVIHMVGPNDYSANRNPSTYRDDIAGRIDQIDAGSTRPVLHILIQSYQRMDVTDRTYAWSEYGDALAALAAQRPDNVAYVGMAPYFAAAGVPGSDPLGLVGDDDLHPTDAGHAMIADLMRRALDIPAAAGPPPTPEVSPSRITSDGFTGDSAIVGRTTDLYLGGAAKTWEGTGGFSATGGKLVGSTSTSSHFVGFPVPTTSAQVSIVVDTLPTAGLVYVDLYRQTVAVSPAPDAYRIEIGPTTTALQKRIGNVATNFATLSSADVVGAITTARWYLGRLYLLLNGTPVFSVPDDSVNRGGYAGIARAGSATDFQLDRFFVDILG